jgi:uncharacterized protein YraI
MTVGNARPKEDMTMTSLLKIALAAAAFAIIAPAAMANTFVAWQVSDVAWKDVLNARAWPSTQSAVRAGYPNGTTLQMTGRCMNGIDLNEISGWSTGAQRKAVRSTWCQIWHDPGQNGNWQTGWVLGRFIKPQGW